MKKNTRSRFWKLAKIAAIIYVVIGVALYFFQDKLLFQPEKLSPTHAFSFQQPFTEINLTVNSEKTISIVQFPVPDSACKGVVLYFHGNRQNIERYATFAHHFTRNNYAVWMVDYPGFGKSTGKRSETVLYKDAAELYKMARSHFAKDSILIYGKSIGTGIAAQLASVKDCHRLILETPYYSIPALLSQYAFIYPVAWMSSYQLPVHNYLEKVTAPITLFHGTDDGVIPYKHAKRLAAGKENTQLITIEKGKHNNLSSFPLFHQQLDSLLQ